MTIATFYEWITLLILVPWALLIVLPGWRGTQLLVHSYLLPVILSLIYLWFFATGAFFGPSVPEGAGFATLDGLLRLFDVPEAVVAGWVHYLVFDLFIGAWEARDARRRGVSHIFLVPCLFFTLMAGPVGLLLYLVIRFATGKGPLLLDEA